jgi:hypothetical protein
VVDEVRVFPTEFRGKHSKLVAYPIGAKALSGALADVPQADQLTCSFSAAGDAHSGRHIREIEHVLWIGYRRVTLGSYEHRVGRRHPGDIAWKLDVYLVEVSQRAAIEQELMRHGLPEVVRPWLLQHVPSGHAVGGEGLSLTYDVAAKKLICEERTTLEPEQA